MQKLVVFGLIFIILLILLIGFYYYRNYSSKKISKSDSKSIDRSDLLSGLDSGGTGTTFNDEEGWKMTHPSLLKNTVMSLKPLGKKTNFKFTMSGPAVGPDGNATIPIQVIRRGPNDLIGFYAQDGDRVKAVIYNINTGKKLGIRSYVGSINNVDSDKWDIEAMEGYNINTSMRILDSLILNNDRPYMSVAIDEFKNIYPKYIREGLFYIRIAGTNLYIGGIIHKDYELGGLSFAQTDINLDRQEFQKNSLTSFADNDGLRGRSNALPILMDLVDGGKNDAKQEYTFTFRDIRQGRGNMKYIGIGDQNAYIISGKQYVIIDLESKQMFYKDSNNQYVISKRWSKGNFNDFYRTYIFINTGLDHTDNYGTSWYIYDVDSDKYLQRKYGTVEAVNTASSKDARWYLEWSPQNSTDGYKIRSIEKMKYLSIYSTLYTSSAGSSFGIFRPEDLKWKNSSSTNSTLSQDTPISVPSLVVTNNKPSQYTFYMKDNNWYMRSGNKYLSLAYFKDSQKIYMSSDENNTLPIEFEPVLTKDNNDMVNRYLKASLSYMKNNWKTNDARQTNLAQFCGNDIRFKDGTLKMETGLADQVANDEVTRAFERICACNMNTQQNPTFYTNALCSDQWIKDNYGIENSSDGTRYLGIRGTLKCNVPECSFQKCLNLYDGNKNQNGIDFTFYGNPEADQTKRCGSNTMCIVNQTINNSGNIVGGQLNMNAKQQCGEVGGDSVKTETGSDYEWINITGSQSVINNQGNVLGGNVNTQQTQSVRFYSEPNFTGTEKIFNIGTYTSQNVGFEIRSMIVPQGYKIEFKETLNSKGNSVLNNEASMFYLTFWKSGKPEMQNIIIISTIPITQTSPKVGPQPIKVYSDINFTGTEKTLNSGTFTSQNIGFPIKSMKVPLGFSMDFRETVNGRPAFVSNYEQNVLEIKQYPLPSSQQQNIIITYSPITLDLKEPQTNPITSLPTEIRVTSQNTEFSNLRSPNEQFKIFFNTTDGNLSIIKVSNNSTVWSVKGINKFVSGVPPPYKLVQGNDGNLVVYGNQPYPVVFSSADTPQWRRGAVRTPYVTTLSNSGVLETRDGNNTVIWSSQ